MKGDCGFLKIYKKACIMKRNFKKIISILLLAVTFFCIINITPTVYASDSVGNAAIDRYKKGLENVNTGADTPVELADNFLGSIIYFLQVIFLAAAIIMAMVLAIKYMASSVNEKAEIKKHLSIYVLGVVLLFAASGLVALLRTIFLEISK